MKIGLVMDKEKTITPLDMGENLAVIDEEKKVVEVYENPGFGIPHGGKEMTMDAMLSLGVEAVVVKKGFLCPGSYSMSLGNVKYLPVNFNKLDDVLQNLEEVKKNAIEELEPEMYAEE
ncbi:hypothetical protein HS7_18350 [Sulfolobales archaeon HS-7]|nr:hypothetical protein HS7_18350 [Sulfolobales archaeon HS-7]